MLLKLRFIKIKSLVTERSKIWKMNCKVLKKFVVKSLLDVGILELA